MKNACASSISGKSQRATQQRKELFIAKEKTPNYTEAQENAIRARAEAGPLNAAAAAELAEAMGKSPRSVIAKIVRMGLPYATKQPTTKTGEPVTKKDALVSQIAAVVEGNLDGLEKAPKPALYALARFVASASARD